MIDTLKQEYVIISFLKFIPLESKVNKESRFDYDAHAAYAINGHKCKSSSNINGSLMARIICKNCESITKKEVISIGFKKFKKKIDKWKKSKEFDYQKKTQRIIRFFWKKKKK